MHIIIGCAEFDWGSVIPFGASDASLWVAFIGLIGVIIGALFTLFGVCIKARYDIFIAKQNYNNQLRLAALDKRLAAHQEAYYRCVKLLNYRHWSNEAERINVSKECESWFFNNCLYLGPESKEKFDTLLYGYGMDRDNKDFMKIYFYPAIRALEDEVALPSLKGESLSWLKEKSGESNSRKS